MQMSGLFFFKVKLVSLQGMGSQSSSSRLLQDGSVVQSKFNATSGGSVLPMDIDNEDSLDAPPSVGSGGAGDGSAATTPAHRKVEKKY